MSRIRFAIRAIVLHSILGAGALFPQGPGTVISGTVQDRGGLPIEGAEVLVREDTVRARTDAAGHFRIAVSGNARGATLVVRKLGYSPFDTQVITPNAPINIVLQESPQSLAEIRVLGTEHDIRGIVLDQNNKGVPGAQVWLLGGGQRLRTDPSGRFDLPIKHSAAFVVSVTKLGYAPARASFNLNYDSGQYVEVHLRQLAGNLSASELKELSGLGMRQTLMMEMGARIAWENNKTSFMVTEDELRARGGEQLDFALCKVQKVNSRIFSCPVSPDCVLEDGLRAIHAAKLVGDAPTGLLSFYHADDVEALEWHKVPGKEKLMSSLTLRGCHPYDLVAVVWLRH